jgi:hypothetical protein
MLAVYILAGMVAVGYLVGSLRSRRDNREVPNPFKK